MESPKSSKSQGSSGKTPPTYVKNFKEKQRSGQLKVQLDEAATSPAGSTTKSGGTSSPTSLKSPTSSTESERNRSQTNSGKKGYVALLKRGQTLRKSPPPENGSKSQVNVQKQVEQSPKGTRTQGEQPQRPVRTYGSTLDPRIRNKFVQTDEIKEVRQLEEDIPPGTEVLARFPDDGWFYFAVVECKVESKDSYRILDATGNKFEISKGDIILDESVPSRDLQIHDYVIALHPCYLYSYAPARVSRTTDHKRGAVLHFYDGHSEKVHIQEIFKIPQSKYHRYVLKIRECENRVAIHDAIVLDRRKGYYRLKVVSAVMDNQEVLVNNKQTGDLEQPARQWVPHVFPIGGMYNHVYTCQKFNTRYVLAPTDTTLKQYLPAEVVGVEDDTSDEFIEQPRIIVRFYPQCDRRQTTTVEMRKCFYLNKVYYNFAIRAYDEAKHYEALMEKRKKHLYIPETVKNPQRIRK